LKLRAPVWGLTILGLLISLCHPWIVEVKAIGVILNGPGMIVMGSLFGYSFARTVLGRVLCWLVTLVLLEPVFRWASLGRKPGRRAVLAGGAATMGGLALGVYGATVERRNYVLEEFDLLLPDLAPELEGLRVVLMSDWHCGPVCRPDDLRPAIRLANSCAPDLILVPGDFISRSGEYFHEAAELASQLRPRLPQGTLISWGNHDYWHGMEIGLKEMPRAGCQILRNRSLLLTPGKEFSESGSRGLWLCGLDDLWAGKPDLMGTLGGLSNCPRLVMSHNPDLAEEQSGARIDLMVSGHTHGGQIWVPTLGTPVLPSRYGQKYASGWVEAPHYPVYVSRGVGTSSLPVRLGVPPEVTLFVLRRGPGGLVRA
jgi:predicted MPP superfamily phosphohydrolase